ncbi:MAG TPA: DUF481 domain-containing protein [Steroidobacteraceae bacterium]|nr:DUF481 domain-containing protein [Steroidobacteraceae bacterium]
MKTYKTLLALILMIVVAGAAAFAGDASTQPQSSASPAPFSALPASSSSSSSSAPMGVWMGKGQLGYVASQGNSPATSANAVLDMSYLEMDWKHSLHFDFLYGEAANVVSAERWDALWQSNYNFTSSLYVFGNLAYVHDLFDGFEYQASGTAGIGYNVIKTDSTALSVQVGAGYLAQRPEEVNKDALGIVTSRVLLPTANTAVGAIGLTYSQKLTPSTSISDSFLLEGGSANSLITNNLALIVKISTKLALNLGYNIVDNTQPPPASPPLKSIDSFETVNLQYSF